MLASFAKKLRGSLMALESGSDIEWAIHYFTPTIKILLGGMAFFRARKRENGQVIRSGVVEQFPTTANWQLFHAIW